ncbi:hypothetical protein LI328DRAFT_92339 [Trichoderma asperelloides]|nr:hypothetical protein LI328DRAFT_92339 [Trichoderma asperelloides]
MAWPDRKTDACLLLLTAKEGQSEALAPAFPTHANFRVLVSLEVRAVRQAMSKCPRRRGVGGMRRPTHTYIHTYIHTHMRSYVYSRCTCTTSNADLVCVYAYMRICALCCLKVCEGEIDRDRRQEIATWGKWESGTIRSIVARPGLCKFQTRGAIVGCSSLQMKPTIAGRYIVPQRVR